MKILYFYQYFSTNNGKWGTRAYEFSKRWVQEGNEVTIFTTVYDKSDLKTTNLFETIYIDGIKIIIFNINVSNKHNILLRLFTFFIYTLFSTLYALFAKYDIVISSSGPITVGIPGLLSKIVRRKKFILEVRDIFADGLQQLGIIKNKSVLILLKLFENYLYKKSDTIVVLSESMKSWIVTKSKISPRKINVVTNATDQLNNIVSNESNIPVNFRFDNKFIIVYYGTIGDANNCVQIVDCALILKSLNVQNLKIWIIGDGKQRLMLEELSISKNLSDILEFHDPVPRKVLFQILQKCFCSLLILRDIEVFDTVSPNKLFDSFSVGLPIIQTTGGWIKSLVDKYEIGINIKSECSQSLANAIYYLINNRDISKKFSTNAKSIGKIHFDRNKLALLYLKILQSVGDEK